MQGESGDKSRNIVPASRGCLPPDRVTNTAQPPLAGCGSESDTGSGRVSLDVELVTAGPEIDVAGLQSRFEAACGFLGTEHAEVALRLVDSAEMAEAHLRYCGVSGPTDVLTFDRGSSGPTGRIASDVLICMDVARSEALKRGHAVEDEVLLYLIHAVLHCLGHDDQDESGYAAMHRIEDEVLESIGVGRRFGGAAEGGASKNTEPNTDRKLDTGD